MMFLFFGKRLRVLNWGVRYSGRSWTQEKFWYEVSAVSSSLALIEDISSSHKSSLSISQDNYSKDSKNSEYAMNTDLTEKLRTFPHQSIHTEKNQRLLSQDYDYH